MNSKLGNPMKFEFNKYAIAITGLFVLTLVLILVLPPALSDLRLLPAGLETVVGGLLGGGRLGCLVEEGTSLVEF